MIPPEWAVVFMVGYAVGSLVVFCIVLCHAPRKPPEQEAAEQSVTTLRERYNALLETQVAAERERLELQQKVEELEREVVQLREQKAPAT